MSSKRDAQTLQKIIDRIDRTARYCENVSFDAFQSDMMLQEACVFNVLQIGELSKQGLSEELVAARPDIPWKQMYGMRNRIVHGYDGVRLRIVWETITDSFPELRQQLQRILSGLTT